MLTATRICTECDKPVLARGMCRSHYRAAGHDKSHHKQTLRTANCTWCGEQFSKVTTNAARMRWCSAECSRNAMRKSWPSCKVFPTVCAQCGSRFIARRVTQLVCSEVCRKERSAKLAGSRDKPCPDCGVILIGLNPATYCESCSLVHKREARRATKHRRRARIKGRHHELIRPTTIYARDQWTCGICHLPVDSALTYPHPQSPSLDHVVPLARGGTHVETNVQLAHLACNRTKSDSMPQPV